MNAFDQSMPDLQFLVLNLFIFFFFLTLVVILELWATRLKFIANRRS